MEAAQLTKLSQLCHRAAQDGIPAEQVNEALDSALRRLIEEREQRS